MTLEQDVSLTDREQLQRELERATVEARELMDRLMADLRVQLTSGEDALLATNSRPNSTE